MRTNKAAFIFLNDLETAHNIICNLDVDSIIVVSHNYALKELEQYHHNLTFFPFEPDNGLFFIDTKRVIDFLSCYLDNGVQYKLPHYVYEPSYLIEGGFGKKVLDTLIAIHVFVCLIDQHKISEIICNQEDSCENNALRLISFSRGITLNSLNNKPQKTIQKIKSKLLSSNVSLLSGIVDFYYNLCTLSQIARIRKTHAKITRVCDLGVISVFDSVKQENWVKDECSSYNGRINYCIFLYRADKAEEYYKSNGIPVSVVEAYANGGQLVSDYIKFIYDRRLIKKKLRTAEAIYFENIEISEYLRALYLSEMRYNKLYDALYDNIVYNFLKNNNVKLLTCDGDTNYMAIKNFYFASKRLGRDIKFFKNLTGLQAVNPSDTFVFEPYVHIYDFLISNRDGFEVEMKRKSGWDGLVYIGQNRSLVEAYMHSLNESKLSDGEYLLWAPSYPYAGFYLYKDFIIDNEKVIKAAATHDVRMVVKYHPSQQDAQVENILSKYSNNSVICFADKTDAIDKYIDKAQFVITTPSLVMIDAALKRKPVIIITNKNNYHRVKQWEKCFTIVDSSSIDDTFLLDIQAKRDYLINRQNEFLNSLFSSEDPDYSEILQHIINCKENEVG